MAKRTLFFVDRLHWLWLTLAAPFLLFPSPKTSLVMLIVPTLILIHWLALDGKPQAAADDFTVSTPQQRSFIPSTPLNGSLVLMMLMVLVSLWATFDINDSLPKIGGMVLGIGAFQAVTRESARMRGWILSLLYFLAIGLGTATLGALGTNWVNSKITQLNPIIARLPKVISGIQGAGSGFHPNEVAGALIWVLPVILEMSVVLFLTSIIKGNDTAEKLRKAWEGKFPGWSLVVATILCLAVTFFIFAVFLLSQSRGGYIALIVTFLVLIVITIPRRFRWHSLALLATFTIAVGILLGAHREAVRTWIVGSNLTADSGNSLYTLEGRQEVWTRAIYGIQDFPLTGMGMNAFRKVMPVFYPLYDKSTMVDFGHAHNEFLQAALDLGIPGLCAFLALYIGAFWILANIWKRSRHQAIRAEDDRWQLIFRLFTLGLGGGLLAHLLFGLTDAVALGAKPGLLFWMLLGLIVGLGQQAQEHASGAERNAVETAAANIL
jgi:putative inorganic carbon (hco3(-)) transporter